MLDSELLKIEKSKPSTLENLKQKFIHSKRSESLSLMPRYWESDLTEQEILQLDGKEREWLTEIVKADMVKLFQFYDNLENKLQKLVQDGVYSSLHKDFNKTINLMKDAQECLKRYFENNDDLELIKLGRYFFGIENIEFQHRRDTSETNDFSNSEFKYDINGVVVYSEPIIMNYLRLHKIIKTERGAEVPSQDL